MKKPNRNVVIRYNISQNGKEGLYFCGFDSCKEAENIHIYNTPHYTRKGLKVSVFPEGRTPINTLFENNISNFEDEASWGKGGRKGINTRYNNNLYYGIEPHPPDKNPMAENPRFRNPEMAGTDIDLTTLKELRGYRVSSRSSVLGAGAVIANDGGMDVFRTKLSGKKPIVGAAAY
ncbi:hypothetical protein JIN77_15950 [Verrucomicrobiaceae bacterium R5-34]|nr:hypothetical protein [Verrucomicrobiaceae bacterium R5-34]